MHLCIDQCVEWYHPPNLWCEIYFCDASKLVLWVRVCIGQFGHHLICAGCPPHHNTSISDFMFCRTLPYLQRSPSPVGQLWAYGRVYLLTRSKDLAPDTKKSWWEAHCEVRHWIIAVSSECLFSQSDYGVLSNCKLWCHLFLIAHLCNETSFWFSCNVATQHVRWLM
jgi:hypothetical protein